ncbi:Fructose-6-phosphate phosphoketolase [Coriobacterium glomerans PW2]|uniref:Fructose-6-phosphate phosphoketolase n=1 Tax=Coriobacterium glomerans (strain ATCC 49209 / DSM 20642 / JCM 10262 / PW2) TaxID=700015 RepID=F2N8L4_CORGP|nr:phosphoketolase family protein [Coriobacterium glomerans]AEB07397.1 Fructose-6-phosphate phosphoketolase [Coriobacterium glomerans PW2]
MSQPVIGTPWKKLPDIVPDDELEGIDRYWRCANYLSVGQIYLRSNPLMRSDFVDEKTGETRDFGREDVKHRLVGHWGTTPGINFLMGHVNRLIADHGQNAIFLMGPGHGGPAGTAQSLLDGTYRSCYPEITDDEAGLQRFFRRFSYPGGIPSHFAPETPGSIHEGGELGYTLSHAYGAVMDNPSLLCVAAIGDGEAETGPLATGWQSNKLVNPATDGIVLPILHLNGYKIANPTILARISDEELDAFFRGMGYAPHVFVAGFDDEDHLSIHRRFADLIEQVFAEICDIKEEAAARIATGKTVSRPTYPMIIFRTPKGWTCPKRIDGQKTEDSWRAHQVPLTSAKDTHEHFRVLRGWLRSYAPDELFESDGAIRAEVTSFMPKGELRIGANPNANGGVIRRDLRLPDARDYEVPVAEKGHGWGMIEAARVFGVFTRDVLKRNMDDFRIFGPDETASNRLQAAYEVTRKQWDAGFYADEDNDMLLAASGKVVEQLSEHQCEGFLEGYVLTGRHGIWSSYESFVHVVDSMINQHCKWLEATVREIDWRKPISGLNILLTSHVWRQDHNGFSHQDPGFVDLLLNKANETHVVNAYYPADANMALAVAERVYASTNCVNAIFCGKQPAPTFQSLDEARAELAEGVAAWDWASSAQTPAEADVVVACCGDVSTLEALAATDLLRGTGVSVRFVNVVDLLKIQNAHENDRAVSDMRFTELFGDGTVPVLFAFHAYAGTIRRLIWNRPGHDAFHVHGYEEKGSTTTPFDMLRLNRMDRWALAAHALRLVDEKRFSTQIASWEAFREEAFRFAVDEGYDHPAFTDWVWPDAAGSAAELSAAQLTVGDNE